MIQFFKSLMSCSAQVSPRRLLNAPGNVFTSLDRVEGLMWASSALQQQADLVALVSTERGVFTPSFAH